MTVVWQQCNGMGSSDSLSHNVVRLLCVVVYLVLCYQDKSSIADASYISMCHITTCGVAVIDQETKSW